MNPASLFHQQKTTVNLSDASGAPTPSFQICFENNNKYADFLQRLEFYEFGTAGIEGTEPMKFKYIVDDKKLNTITFFENISQALDFLLNHKFITQEDLNKYAEKSSSSEIKKCISEILISYELSRPGSPFQV